MPFRLLLLFVLACLAVRAADAPAAADLERQVAELTQSEQVTIVHLWAPWCPNCTTELKEHGWSDFIAQNPQVKVVFVTIWAGDKGDGRALLEKHGVTQHANFQFFSHPNTSRARADKMTQFLGQPVTWIPTTWVYRKGTLRYALNYGEVRFPILQQLVKDAAGKW